MQCAAGRPVAMTRRAASQVDSSKPNDLMKVVQSISLFEQGAFCQSQEMKQVRDEVVESIERVVWPAGSDKFTINPTRDGNGVIPVRMQFQRAMVEPFKGWQLEAPFSGAGVQEFGDIDASKKVPGGRVGVEWETGHVTSSHRSMNKLSVGVEEGDIDVGIMIVPCFELSQYLTDRVGNIEELTPYFRRWRKLDVPEGRSGGLYIIVIQHDAIDKDVPLIPKQAKAGVEADAFWRVPPGGLRSLGFQHEMSLF
jgi:hypothetical protein